MLSVWLIGERTKSFESSKPALQKTPARSSSAQNIMAPCEKAVLNFASKTHGLGMEPTGNRFSPKPSLANDDQAHTDSGGVANSCLFPKDTVSGPRRRHLDSKSDRVSLYKLQRCLQGSPADCCGPNLIKSPPPSKSNCVRLKTRCSVTKCATTGV